MLTYAGHGGLRGGWTTMRAQPVAAFPLEKRRTHICSIYHTLLLLFLLVV